MRGKSQCPIHLAFQCCKLSAFNNPCSENRHDSFWNNNSCDTRRVEQSLSCVEPCFPLSGTIRRNRGGGLGKVNAPGSRRLTLKRERHPHTEPAAEAVRSGTDHLVRSTTVTPKPSATVTTVRSAAAAAKPAAALTIATELSAAAPSATVALAATTEFPTALTTPAELSATADTSVSAAALAFATVALAVAPPTTTVAVAVAALAVAVAALALAVLALALALALAATTLTAAGAPCRRRPCRQLSAKKSVKVLLMYTHRHPKGGGGQTHRSLY